MKLVPPNITPDWTPSQDRVGLKRIEYHYDRGKWWQIQNWDVQDDDQHEADCKFFLAAPAMAEALAECLPDWWPEVLEDKRKHDGEICTEITYGDVRRIIAALMAAGYTVEAADQS